MLCRAKDLLGRHIRAVDGDIGKVRDVFVDDATWAVRYVVVDTAGWLDRHEVLLSPRCLGPADPRADVIETELTQERVRQSPPVASDMPVSRAYEERLHSHYGWAPYWQEPFYTVPGLYMYPMPLGGGATPGALDRTDTSTPREVQEMLDKRVEEADPHLRSFKEMKGYHIEAEDGEVGHVDDLLIDADGWRVTHLIVDTRNWLPGKHVVIDKGTVRAVRWEDGRVAVALTREQVKGSPEYDPSMQIDEGYQTRLSSYYRNTMEDAGIGGGHAF